MRIHYRHLFIMFDWAGALFVEIRGLKVYHYELYKLNYIQLMIGYWNTYKVLE